MIMSDQDTKGIKEHIPIFKSWKRWYVAVLIFLVLEIIIFYIITNQLS